MFINVFFIFHTPHTLSKYKHIFLWVASSCMTSLIGTLCSPERTMKGKTTKCPSSPSVHQFVPRWHFKPRFWPPRNHKNSTLAQKTCAFRDEICLSSHYWFWMQTWYQFWVDILCQEAQKHGCWRIVVESHRGPEMGITFLCIFSSSVSNEECV